MQEGYGEFQVFHDRGERADMFRQYLRPAMGRSNLTVVTGAQTQQVVFEKQGSRPRARGVLFSVAGPDGTKHSGVYHCPVLCMMHNGQSAGGLGVGVVMRVSVLLFQGKALTRG